MEGTRKHGLRMIWLDSQVFNGMNITYVRRLLLNKAMHIRRLFRLEQTDDALDIVAAEGQGLDVVIVSGERAQDFLAQAKTRVAELPRKIVVFTMSVEKWEPLKSNPMVRDIIYAFESLEAILQDVYMKKPNTTFSSVKEYLDEEGICPVTNALMEHACIARDGYMYEKSAIQDYLQKQSRSPVTGKLLDNDDLIDNPGLQRVLTSLKALA